MPKKGHVTKRPSLGLATGVGLVVANMVGAGVFLSSGFMAQDLSPGMILLSWSVGALIALAGATCYAQLALISGRSGGEYRYLYDYMHPYFGYLAGWASLLIGFAAPVAIDVFVAGAFLKHLFSDINVHTFGTLAIICLTLAHGVRIAWSQSVQNLLACLKFLFIIFFILLGLILGSKSWPDWQPTNNSSGLPFSAFLESQYWIAFAFSGWNAAVYVTEEFRNPRRDTSRAILLGFAIVTTIYLAVNWIFVANLSPTQSAAVFDHEATRITLAHLVVEDLIGRSGAQTVSMVAVLVFLSAASAMTLVGPRVYSAMAKDGLLPAFFSSCESKPPFGAVIIQGALALLLLHTQSVLDIVISSSAVLMFFSMLTVLTLFSFRRAPEETRPRNFVFYLALFYVASALTILCAGAISIGSILLTFSCILAIGTAGYIRALKLKSNLNTDKPLSPSWSRGAKSAPQGQEEQVNSLPL